MVINRIFEDEVDLNGKRNGTIFQKEQMNCSRERDRLKSVNYKNFGVH